MKENLDQERRLSRLVEAFKEDSRRYRDLETPEDTEGKRRLLRSLMNIRMPGPLPEEVLALQDKYLRIRAEERGVVDAMALPTVRDMLHSPNPQGKRIALWQGDITLLRADAIVNAANSQMLGCFQPMHACIDNCIHSFAGIQLRAECGEKMAALRRRYGAGYEQPTGIPMLTEGYNLPARKVIHVVGPIVAGHLTPELERELRSCYTNTLDLALENGLKSVAFCCISTGVFRFPAERAAQLAVEAVTEWLNAHGEGMDRVIFNVFREEDLRIYERLLS